MDLLSSTHSGAYVGPFIFSPIVVEIMIYVYITPELLRNALLKPGSMTNPRSSRSFTEEDNDIPSTHYAVVLREPSVRLNPCPNPDKLSNNRVCCIDLRIHHQLRMDRDFDNVILNHRFRPFTFSNNRNTQTPVWAL